MQDKQKVTFYLPESLHKDLRIKSAVNGDSMSELAQRAISFYLAHSDIVESSGVGHTHQIYNCPSCSQTVVIREGELLAIGGNRSSVITVTTSKSDSHGEGLLPIA